MRVGACAHGFVLGCAEMMFRAVNACMGARGCVTWVCGVTWVCDVGVWCNVCVCDVGACVIGEGAPFGVVCS